MNDKNNTKELELPLCIFDITKELTPEQQTAYLQGMGAAFYTIFGVLQSHGNAIMIDAEKTGRLPHPVTVLTLTLATIKQFIMDNQILRDTLTEQGSSGLESMLTLINSQAETKVIQ